MSLAIDTDTVAAVLLADGWHEVLDHSFDIDSYEFLWSGERGVTVAELEERSPWQRDPLLVHGGGQSGVCAAGFAFKGTDGRFCGPLTAVLGVRLQAHSTTDKENR